MNHRWCLWSCLAAISCSTACADEPYPYRGSHGDRGGGDLPGGDDELDVDAGPPTGGNGSVWLLGTLAEGSCGRDALQPLYPDFDADSYSIGFDCYTDRMVYRRSDRQLFYHAAFTGILEDRPSDQHESDNDLVVPTPPCDDQVDSHFDFDGAGVLHYRCSDGTDGRLYRGNGELIHPGIHEIAGVLDDGRIIVTEFDEYVVLGPDGVEQSRFAPAAGRWPDPSATTVVGNTAYLLYTLTENVGPGPIEHLVVMGFSGTDSWTELADIVVDDPGYYRLTHPAGRVFVNGPDPTTTFDHHIRSFDFAGAVTVHWRERDQEIVRLHINDQLILRP